MKKKRFNSLLKFIININICIEIFMKEIENSIFLIEKRNNGIFKDYLNK